MLDVEASWPKSHDTRSQGSEASRSQMLEIVEVRWLEHAGSQIVSELVHTRVSDHNSKMGSFSSSDLPHLVRSRVF